MNRKNTTEKALKRLIEFDFDQYYHSNKRTLCHILMWTVFSIFIYTNLLYGYGLEYKGALLFLLRSLICNMCVFYFFFYIIIPHTLLKNRILLTIPFFFISILLWLFLNHFCFYEIYKNIEVINVASLREIIKFGANQSMLDLIHPKYILAELITVLYSISPFFFIKTLFNIAKFYSNNIKTERKTSRLEIENLQIETKFLKTQLNPHFLFNTLNNLYGMALSNDQKISLHILQLSDIMRYTLYESNIDKVPLGKELSFIENYVKLEKIRYKKGKIITLQITNKSVKNLKIAPLLTFTFIENAFKYGLKSKHNSFLKIKIAVIDKTFYFTAINDAEPNDLYTDIDGHAGGIGIINVKKRLELLYPDKYQLTIDQGKDDFRVNLQIEME